MKRALATVTALAVGLVVIGAEPVAGQDPRNVYVNTTEDLTLSNEQCLPGQICTFRAAILRAEGRQGAVTACFAPDVVPNALPCPPNASPLQADDKNFNAETGKWTLEFAKGAVSFDLSRGGTIIDFTRMLDGWSGPADNRVALDADITRPDRDDPKPTEAFIIEGSDNVVSGLDIRGQYAISAFLVRGGASNNQFGPGLVLAGINEGVGIGLEGNTTVANRVIGNWCGISGDGTTVEGLKDHCIRIFKGASANVIGGPDPTDRNILVGDERGSGVAIEGVVTRDNVVQGNWIGVGLDGVTAIPNDAGVQVIDGSLGTRIVGNVISGNRNHGIAIAGEGTGTVVEDNIIGRDVEGKSCVENGALGISIDGGASEVRIQGNRIHCNRRAAIVVRSSTSQGIHLTENSITRNGGAPLDLAPGANGDIQPPIVNVISGSDIRGRACPGCVVEFYTDPGDEAEQFEDRVTASETDGTYQLEKSGGFRYSSLRATMTDGMNTSTFSEPDFVPRERPTSTPFGYKTPTPRPTDPVGLFTFVHLPWAGVGLQR